MATGLTKTALIRLLAEKLELTNKQVAAFLDTLAETAIKETRRTGYSSSPASVASSRLSARPAWAATRRQARPSRSRPRPW